MRQARNGLTTSFVASYAKRLTGDLWREFIEPRDAEIAALKRRIAELEAAVR